MNDSCIQNLACFQMAARNQKAEKPLPTNSEWKFMVSIVEFPKSRFTAVSACCQKENWPFSTGVRLCKWVLYLHKLTDGSFYIVYAIQKSE